MDSATRKAKLEELKANQFNQAMTGIPLRYKGSTRTEIVWRIPLDYLIYNKYNGRIGSDVLSYERQNGDLNAELDTDRAIIEKFLYESKVDRNRTTMDSLLKNGQQRYGIVTSDGIIVDGNRRAMLLNRLFHQHDEMGLSYTQVEHCRYFLAIILPDDAEEKDIQQLETIYQMGEDDTYNERADIQRFIDGWLIPRTNKKYCFYAPITENALSELCVDAGLQIKKVFKHDGSCFIIAAKPVDGVQW